MARFSDAIILVNVLETYRLFLTASSISRYNINNPNTVQRWLLYFSWNFLLP